MKESLSSDSSAELAARVHALIAQWSDYLDTSQSLIPKDAMGQLLFELDAALTADPQETEVGIPMVQEVLHHPDCDATPRGFVPQDDLGKLAEEVVRQIARWVNQQPYADLESNRVEQTVYRALQIARGETFTNSPMCAALAAALAPPINERPEHCTACLRYHLPPVGPECPYVAAAALAPKPEDQ